ncbi:MAG: peptidyl-prolyl cis-trans isomerase [Nitrospirae bacterium]|nr:peptidyl-prolyl cis-trans isomerase [Nitrospirota bacterium]
MAVERGIKFIINSRYLQYIFAGILLIFITYGCASVRQAQSVLAIVDGESITIDDVNYALAIEHRRENLSATEKLDIKGFIDSIIGDKLIIQEARRIGLDQYLEVKDKLKAYILRESVVKLHEDEIVKKVNVSDEEILNYYKDNYKRITYDIVELNTMEDALSILNRLNEGEDFKEIALTLPNYEAKDKERVSTFGSFDKLFQEKISDLGTGEFSDVIELNNSFYIIKILGREDAPPEKFSEAASHITKIIRNKKEDDRGNEYLSELRAASNIVIDNEILSSIKLLKGEDERDKWVNDTSPLVVLDGEIFTVKDFIFVLPPVVKISNEVLIKNWIDRKIVDREALSRNYNLDPELSRYRDQVFKNVYIKEYVLPNINVSEDLLRNYYNEHLDNYMEPQRYRMQVITAETKESAEAIYDSLLKGADFAWLAKMRSTDVKTAEKGGNLGWQAISLLPKPLIEVIDSIEAEGISPVLSVDSVYAIYRVQEKAAPLVKDFNSVRQDVYRSYFAEQFKKSYNEYIEKLKSDAEIIINENAIKSFAEMFKP